ncbi:uncharacterized protein LOC130451615 [Diorhabda sublineata]|uniref:uncharacterized protein LOC130451615 n=1 Tax=Diorhabda sublineata TaxID=1163346 RepID=UPI0024E11636|nr:uncharacterized protein LOC130451615 [Diorhabda sublineata]
MRGVFLILVLLAGFAVCYGQTGNKITHNKHHKHCDKWILLQKFYFLTFLALKFKAILAVGSIWAIAFIFGKILTAFKIAEYMKKKDKPEIIYSKPHYHYKSLHPPSDYAFDFPSKGVELGSNGHINSSPGYGRSYTMTNSNDSFISLNMLFENIRRSNLTEMVFEEMNLNTQPCKMKFVCEADFNAKQSIILEKIFNLFIDDSYKKYRTNIAIKRIEECTRLYPKCEKVIPT